MGLAKRRLYKPERAPARFKGVLEKQAPVGCPDASKFEIAAALYAICDQAGVTVGRGGSYETLKDVYTVVGKSKATGKAQDVKVQGLEVASTIKLFRSLNGGKATAAADRLKKRRAVAH